MTTFFIRRLLTAVPTLLIITIMVFAVQRLLPGDPALILAGEERDPAVIEYIREVYRLNEPIYVQYGAWLGQVAQGNLGRSIRTRQPVRELIFEKLPVTIQLAFLSITIAIIIAIPAGIVAAVYRRSFADFVSTLVALSGLSIPNFWLGIMLILFFSVELNLLPASGYVPFREAPLENLQRMIMPAFVLGTGLAAVLMRQMRSSMLEVLRSHGTSQRTWGKLSRCKTRPAQCPHPCSNYSRLANRRTSFRCCPHGAGVHYSGLWQTGGRRRV